MVMMIQHCESTVMRVLGHGSWTTGVALHLIKPSRERHRVATYVKIKILHQDALHFAAANDIIKGNQVRVRYFSYYKMLPACETCLCRM